MGVPADLAELDRTGIISPAGLVRAREDESLPGAVRDGDVCVAEYVGSRFGAEVVDRLVEPLLGGVYAGRADQLSFDATLPALSAESRRHASLAQAVRALLPPAPPPGSAGPGLAEPGLAEPGAAPAAPPPVFTTLPGGLGSLPDVLAKASGANILTRATVRELARTPDGWRLTIGPAVAPERIDADAVILALPARPASRLLAQVEGAAAAAVALAEIEYASMAIVTLAYPPSAFAEPLAGSGYLVPAVDGRPVKAVTFSSVKWPHLTAGLPDDERVVVVRCSLGRIGEEAVLQRDDAELAELAAADLATAGVGLGNTAGDGLGRNAPPVDSRVTRWGGGLPQYTVGHLDRVSRIRAGVAAQPGLAICGAAFDGVGIPACIATARLAVGQVLSTMPGARE